MQPSPLVMYSWELEQLKLISFTCSTGQRSEVKGQQLRVTRRQAQPVTPCTLLLAAWGATAAVHTRHDVCLHTW